MYVPVSAILSATAGKIGPIYLTPPELDFLGV
jgi:hypothetical protein